MDNAECVQKHFFFFGLLQNTLVVAREKNILKSLDQFAVHPILCSIHQYCWLIEKVVTNYLIVAKNTNTHE